ncbi:hypothetical protein P5673_021488 [Acropora cervicornis]|uniref:Uncharacterized protein n=1 Tax=Acropora cervicornis TaxID=6130 RepID=A0AAD9Q8E1_ACRCE|nr:hypothetical protein P5673_021488 [Acropora cervicornis]
MFESSDMEAFIALHAANIGFYRLLSTLEIWLYFFTLQMICVAKICDFETEIAWTKEDCSNILSKSVIREIITSTHVTMLLYSGGMQHVNDVILTSCCDIIDSDWVVTCVISLDIFQANLKICAGNILKWRRMIVVFYLPQSLGEQQEKNVIQGLFAFFFDGYLLDVSLKEEK